MQFDTCIVDVLEEMSPARLARREVPSGVKVDRLRRRAVDERLASLRGDYHVALTNDVECVQ